MARRFPPIAVALCCALIAGWAFGLRFIAVSSPTFDEPVHLASGYTALHEGDYSLNALDHPPLAEMWAAAPLLALRPQTFPNAFERREDHVYHYGDLFLYCNSIRPGVLTSAPRLFNLLTLSTLVFLVLAVWASRLGGKMAAAGALAAAALCPVLISNLSLVTTDGASAALWFAALWLLSRDESRSVGKLAAAGVVAGLAAAAKYNMAPLIPLGIILFTADYRLRRGAKSGFPWTGAVAFVLAALAALAAVYRVAALPLYERGLAATFHRMGEARSYFLLGARGTTGSWLYFPVAFVLKTPLATLLLAGLGAAAATKRLGRREALWLFAPPAIYLAAAMSLRLDIGVRHLLPVVPFFLLFAGLGVAELWQRPRGKTAVALLGAWAFVSVATCAPHLLAYFNELCGGPAGGYRVLADSNLDWGQDLRGLARYLAENGNPRIYLSYFGTADPAAEGVRYAPVLFMPHVERPGDAADPATQDRILLAVSATNLQGVYFADPKIFAWLKAHSPARVFGDSLFLYDLTPDPDGQARLAQLLAFEGRADLARSLAARARRTAARLDLISCVSRRPSQ